MEYDDIRPPAWGTSTVADEIRQPRSKRWTEPCRSERLLWDLSVALCIGKRRPTLAENALLHTAPAARGRFSSCFRWSDAMPAKPKTGGYASGQVEDDDESDDSDEGQSRVDAGTGPDAETQPQISRASTAEAKRYLRSKQEEKAHFLEVCLLGLTFRSAIRRAEQVERGYSFMEYGTDAYYDLGRMQETVQSLDKADMAMWKIDPLAWYNEIQKRVQINLNFLQMLPNPDVCGADLGRQAWQLVTQVPEGHRVASRNSSKVRSTLRQFVRDWSREGQAERQASYGPLVSALLRHLPPKGQAKAPAVLCPGCGLARLPFDLVRLGYAAQGNEFSYHMLLGSHLILNRSDRAECFNIFPFVKVPDICPCEALAPTAQLSMAAGEFVEVYKTQAAEWDGMATCFFLDTAKNVFMYIRLIAHIMRPGGRGL
ncbi:Carnmt1 [Symbiodinium sp. CCMP2456]|nr:Carnmt1 [Symbiodinium sp. CCMP2456]